MGVGNEERGKSVCMANGSFCIIGACVMQTYLSRNGATLISTTLSPLNPSTHVPGYPILFHSNSTAAVSHTYRRLADVNPKKRVYDEYHLIAQKIN